MSLPPRSSRLASQRIVIVGGGLAGIAAAVRLAETGATVTLVETRKRLGGRATSFTDPTTGQTLDNCQHVLMGCCTNLLDLYRKLGVENSIEWHRRLFFMNLSQRNADSFTGSASPAIDVLESDDLPAPLHMTRALMSFGQLTLLEKLAISRAMLAIMRLTPAARGALHTISFAQWLEDHGQPAGAIEKFWAPVVISALNELPEQCAADYAIHVYQDGFLSSADAYVMGLSRVPLVQLYDAAETVITRGGGQLMLGTSADRFEYENGCVTALILGDGSRLEADAFVSALPFDRLAKVCTPDMYKSDMRLRRLDRFSVSPIIGVHLWFECAGGEPVMNLPHVTFTQSPLQWIFSKGMEKGAGLEAWGLGSVDTVDSNAHVQHLHGVISAAYEMVDWPAEKIIETVAAEVRKAFPRARNARLIHARAVKEKRATFAPRPGVDAMRPSAGGGIANLFLAGDWCKTGWPATMEGAVRSGYLAAGQLIRDMRPTDATLGDAKRNGEAESPLVPDLPSEMMYRMIQG